MDYMKIMATFAVAGIAAVAGADVTSSVVGYSQSDLDNNGGSVIVTPQFLGIGTTGGAVDLQTIKCNEEAEDLVSLNVLDNLGYTLDTYYWTTYKGNYCWLDDSTMKPAENVTFAPGQAFWIQSDEAGFTITFPGVELNN